MNDLEHELRRRVEGDVRFDRYSRLLYSTDASMYQMEPIGVVIPRHADDVQAVIEVCNRQGAPLLPRGGGTSLTGQTVNRAVVLDFSRHMAGVLEVNPEERWVRVQPGVVQDELNHHVRPLGLLFGPDTSTSNRATIGGMLGNNSGGSHSIAYGLTVEHVLELETILADGSRVTFGEVTPAEFEARARRPGLEGQIYREVGRIRTQYEADIRSSYPRHWRRVCGYNLDELVKDRPLNMARLIVGSEGTFLTVVAAKMRLVRKPKATAVDVIHYHDMQEALESSQAILETGPYAVELTDKMILDLARNNIEQSQRMGFVQGDPAAILIVEYAGDTEQEVKAKVVELEARRSRGRFGYATHIATDPAEQQSIWKLRKAGLGLLLGTRGESKPIAFIEDTAVDPKHLPEFVPRFTEIMARHGADAAYYGHCSVGCLHIRPLINLKEERGLRQVQAIAEEITALVMEFGGALSGEHGDGLVRGAFMRKMFGDRLYEAFRTIKKTCDPHGVFNPGKIVDSPPITENLRFGAGYTTPAPATFFDYSDYGGMGGAVEMCSGLGACRKTLDGTMCPSYMVTREEAHSTRGRANVLRLAMVGRLGEAGLGDEGVYETLDLCL
ncbi:MAG TPA: FAD-binding oxidoreductase, partial [Methylomirabilota bacterium]